MSRLMALSITTGIICGIWVHVAVPLGLLSWLGFAGCTTYFASGKHGFDGMFTAMRQNMFGVLCGMTIIFLSTQFPFYGNGIVFSGFITFVMCIAAKWKYLAFIPGTFVGSFSTFAANGEWQGVVIALLIGAVIGIACDSSGGWLYKLVGKPEEEEAVEEM
ncbi:MAG: DUF1097 domain-containing protein [Erysipelotrichales bacterium]